MIILDKKNRNNKKPLVIINVNKTIIAEFVKVSNFINLNDNYD